MDTLIIFGAKYLIAGTAAVVAAYMSFLPREQKIRLGLIVLAALPLAWVLARIAGMFFSHQQPFATEGFEPLIPHEVGNSFPSDHSAFAMALAAAAWFFNRYLGAALALAALVVGASRILAGLHYPVDVLAGLLVGAAAAGAARLIILYFARRTD